MQEQFSRHSMLRTVPMDDRHLSSIIDSVERPIRAMCRVMQVYEDSACTSINNVEKDYEDLVSVFSAFYQYVDFQMNRLSEMSEEMETWISHVSINKIRQSEDFQRKKLPRYAFNSEESYQQYCAEFDAERAQLGLPIFDTRNASDCAASRTKRKASGDGAPASADHRESPFNDAFGDSVAPANKIRGVKS